MDYFLPIKLRRRRFVYFILFVGLVLFICLLFFAGIINPSPANLFTELPLYIVPLFGAVLSLILLIPRVSYLSVSKTGVEYTGMTKSEFTEAFTKELIRLAGSETFDDGGSIAKYRRETGPTYWENTEQRSEGPQECAAADYSYWE